MCYDVSYDEDRREIIYYLQTTCLTGSTGAVTVSTSCCLDLTHAARRLLPGSRVTTNANEWHGGVTNQLAPHRLQTTHEQIRCK